MSQAVLGLVDLTVELRLLEAPELMSVVVAVLVESLVRMQVDRLRPIVTRLVVGVIDSTMDHVVGFNVMSPAGKRKQQVWSPSTIHHITLHLFIVLTSSVLYRYEKERRYGRYAIVDL